MVRWLRVCASKAEGTGSAPSQGTKIPHATQQGQKKKKKKKRTENQDSEGKNVILKLEGGPRIFFPWTEKGKWINR